jgi:hypothetical protein
MRERTCRVCGCTESRPCPGGCAWSAPDACSACVPRRGSVELADVVAAAVLEDCYWSAVDLGLIDAPLADDAPDLLEGGW